MADVQNYTHFYGTSDAKVFPITADSAAAYTCDTGIDVLGIKNFACSPTVEEQKLTGDGVTMETVTKIKEGTFSFECAKTDFQLLATLWGGRYSADDTVNTFSLQQGDTPKYFQFAVKPEQIDAALGSAGLHLMKCKINSSSSEGAEDSFNTVKVSGTMLFTTKTFVRSSTDGATSKTAGLMQDYKLYAADTALSAITT